MTLKEHVAKARLEDKIMPRLIEELYDMYHNASLKSFPYNDEDSEEFWEWLGDYTRWQIKDMQNHIGFYFGYQNEGWTLFQCGRSGATIAPSMLISHRHGYNRPDYDLSLEEAYEFLQSSLNLDAGDLGDESYDEPPEDEAYESYLAMAEEYLEIITYINTSVADAVAGIDESWKEYKEEVRDE